MSSEPSVQYTTHRCIKCFISYSKQSNYWKFLRLIAWSISLKKHRLSLFVISLSRFVKVQLYSVDLSKTIFKLVFWMKKAFLVNNYILVISTFILLLSMIKSNWKFNWKLISSENQFKSTNRQQVKRAFCLSPSIHFRFVFISSPLNENK